MGKGVSRAGSDKAGGVITGPKTTTNVYVNGKLVPIGSGVVVDDGDTIDTTSSSVYMNGLGPIRQGDIDTGGHTATGSWNVFSG